MEKPLKSPLTRRTFLAGSAVAAAAAGLTLAGCGGGGNEEKPADNGGDTPKSDTPAAGGTLTGAMAYTSTNVNPIGNLSLIHIFSCCNQSTNPAIQLPCFNCTK